MFKKIAKRLYILMPFKKYLFLILKYFYSPSQKIYQHLYFNGVFNVFSGTNTFKMYHTGTIIENQLFWRGLDGFEPHSLKLWSRLSRDAETIFDLGANSGIYSLISKSENSNANVYAFECVDRVFDVLTKNINHNNYDIKCYKQAISNKNGKGFFIDDYEDFTQSVIVNLDLDDVAKGRGVDISELHKVETHEPEVFEGFQKYFKAFQPTFIIEIIRDHVALSLEKQFADLNYIFFYINEPFGGVESIVEGDIYQKVDTLIGKPYGNYLICSPAKAIELKLI